MNRRKAMMAFSFLIAMTSSWGESKPGQQKRQIKQSQYNVLFIGNSLTYANDLPKLVRQEAARQGVVVHTKTHAKANYAIVDHWAEGEVQRLIKTKLYDFVVIQQGPSSQQDGYRMLVNGGAPYAELTRQNNAQLAYYMVWPALEYYFTFQGVIDNYTAGAEANDAILIPVGTRWRQYIADTGDRSYYGSDGFHPSKKGSQMAAEVIVETLFNPATCDCSD